MVRGKTKLLAALLIVGALAAFSYMIRDTRCIAVSGAGVLSINLDQIKSGHARTFCYTDRAGEKIRFILARGSDGKIRSVFDACRQCYTYHRGYAVSGGDLICRVCGNRYRVEQMLTGKASCVPVGLPHQEESGVAKVKTADVVAGRALF
jgi:uncharacterized membrane protein